MNEDDLVTLLPKLIEALVNNTKATYLVRRELQTQVKLLTQQNNLIEEELYKSI